MVRVPIAPQVEAQVPQGPSGAPQFQAPPMPGMQKSQQLAQDIGRAGQMAMDVQRDEQALALYQQRMAAKEKATQDALIAKRQAAIDESMVQQALTLTASQSDEIVDIYGRAKGKAAVDRYQEALSALDAVSKAIGDNLPEGLRPAFTMAAMQQQLIARRGINKHFGKESDAWDTNTKQEWIGSLANDAVAGYDTLDDPSGVYATSMGAAMRAVEQIQVKSGETANSPATMRIKRQIWESVTTQVADNLIRDKDFAGAMKHVEDVAGAGMMSEAQLTKLRDAIETSEANSSALATADNLFERGATGSTKPFEGTTPEPGYEPLPTLPNGDPDIGAMKKVINDADRPTEWKDAAILRLDRLESQRIQEANRVYRSDLEAARNIAFSPEAYELGVSLYESVPPELMARLEPQDRESLKELPLQTDIVVFEELSEQIPRLPPGQAIPLVQANRANLSRSDFARLMSIASTQEADRPPVPDFKAFADQAMRDYAPTAFSDTDRRARFYDTMRQELEAETARGNKISPEFMRKVANRLANDKATLVVSYGFDKQRTVAGLSYEQRAKAYRNTYKDAGIKVSVTQEQAIMFSLANKGVVRPTVQQVADEYSKMVRGEAVSDKVIADILMSRNVPVDTINSPAGAQMVKTLRAELKERLQ